MTSLFNLLNKFGSTIGRQILISLGIGIASGGIILTILNHYLNKIIQQSGFIGTGAFLFNLAGIDICISIIIGACIVRASLSAAGITLAKLNK